MRFGRTLLSFIGLTVMLSSGELWLRHGLAAQKSRIVFASLRFDNYEIYVMDADGGNRENLSNHPSDDKDPDWSPDGTKIAFISRRTGDYQIYVMDADGKNPIRLTDGPRLKQDLDWSPDGGKIAFTVRSDHIPIIRGEGQVPHIPPPHIAVMDADGNNRVRLVDQASEPSWSPDGGEILFVSKRDANHDILMIGADGQGLERVTHGWGGHNPSYSPDGQRIACQGAHEGFKHIYVVGADGKNRQRLTHNREHHSHPTWSPDGGAIAYVVSKDLFFEDATIHLMTADGKYIKQLSKGRNVTDEQPDFSPVGLAVSPTSKTATIWGRLKVVTYSHSLDSK